MILSLRLRSNSPNVVQDTIDGEVVIVNLKTGSYYSLDKVGVDVWGLLESGHNVGDVVNGIADRYEGTRTEIERAVIQLATELQNEELMVAVSGDYTGVPEKGAQIVQSAPHTQKLQFVAPTLQKYTDMQDLLLLDPIHDVDEKGWPIIRTDKPQQ